MIRSRFIILAALCGGLAVSTVCQAAPKASSGPAAGRIDLKQLLAGPAGGDPEPERMGAMEVTLRAADTPLERAAVELAMANWLLAVPTASPATRWIVGLPEKSDLHRIHEAASDAQEHLARARKLLSGDRGEGKERRRELQTAASLLEAFAKVLGVCADDASAPGYKQACEDAAIGLADARESEKQPVAAAAMMWQSLAWVVIDRHERALTTLPDALSKPDRLPYDFAAKLLRCRVLAESGQPAAAVAQLMHLQSSCDEWFSQLDKAALESRRRLVAALQWKLTVDWLAKLTTQSAQAGTRVEGTLSGLEEVLAPKGQAKPVYHLENALPIIVELPALSTPVKPSASKPAAEKPTGSAIPASAPASTSAKAP